MANLSDNSQNSNLFIEGEIWLPITGYEKLYQVSNTGKIKTQTGIRKTAVCPNTRYEKITLSKEGVCKTFSIHRLVAQAFIPNPYNKEQVNHIDGNRTNNILTNLEWNTRSENNLHSFKYLGRKTKPVFGEKNNMSRKVINTVTNIVYDTIIQAAKENNLKTSTLGMMLTGKNPNYTNLQYLTI